MAGGNTATHPPMGHTKAEPLMAPTDGELGITLASSVGLLAVPVWLGLQWGCSGAAGPMPFSTGMPGGLCATGEVMLQAAGHCLGCPGK